MRFILNHVNSLKLENVEWYPTFMCQVWSVVQVGPQYAQLVAISIWCKFEFIRVVSSRPCQCLEVRELIRLKIFLVTVCVDFYYIYWQNWIPPCVVASAKAFLCMFTFAASQTHSQNPTIRIWLVGNSRSLWAADWTNICMEVYWHAAINVSKARRQNLAPDSDYENTPLIFSCVSSSLRKRPCLLYFISIYPTTACITRRDIRPI